MEICLNMYGLLRFCAALWRSVKVRKQRKTKEKGGEDDDDDHDDDDDDHKRGARVLQLVCKQMKNYQTLYRFMEMSGLERL